MGTEIANNPNGVMMPDDLRSVVGDGYVYLASPYSRYEHGMERAFELASAAAAKLMLSGIPVYCPIAHTHPIAIHGEIPQEGHEFWLAQDFPLLDRSNALVILGIKGWIQSYGVAREVDRSLVAGRPIYLMPPCGSSVVNMRGKIIEAYTNAA